MQRWDSKEATGSADLEGKAVDWLHLGFILPDAQMPRCPKCPDDQIGLQDRGTGEDTLPSGLPRSILDLKPHSSSTVSRPLSADSGTK